MSASGLRELNALWEARGRSDEYFGTLVNSYLSKGGLATGVKAGESYVDVGTLHGYRTAMTLLLSRRQLGASRGMPKRQSAAAAALHGAQT
jgi:glucose-1-phosphate thymidylyltransferase